MGSDGLASATRFLVLALAALYCVSALAGLLFIDFETTRDVVFWLFLLLGGAALMLVGTLALPPSGPSAALVSVGAALGGLPLFWTIIVPIAVASVVATSIALARRAAPA